MTSLRVSFKIHIAYLFMSWPILKVLLDHIQSQPRQTMQPQNGYLRHFIFFSHSNNTWQINEGFWNCDWHHDARSTTLNIWAKSTLVRSSEESKSRLHLPVVVKSPVFEAVDVDVAQTSKAHSLSLPLLFWLSHHRLASLRVSLTRS